MDLGGLFLSDSLEDPSKYRIPTGKPDSTTIPAHGYLLLWADGQEEQGVLHLGFKLDSKSEQIGLYQLEAGMIDSLSYRIDFLIFPWDAFRMEAVRLQYVSASPGIGKWVLSGWRAFHINEFVAENLSPLSDEYGEYDDWIEIYNGNDLSRGPWRNVSLPIHLADPAKYRVPAGKPDSTVIPASWSPSILGRWTGGTGGTAPGI